MKNDEHFLYGQLADYMAMQYPEIIFRFDLAADLKLTPGQANRHKRLHRKRGYPDLFIAEPKTIKMADGKSYPLCGLFLELKKSGEKIYSNDKCKRRFKSKDNIEYRSEHLKEQADYLFDLRKRRYAAGFAVGFEEAIHYIDAYLKGGENEIQNNF